MPIGISSVTEEDFAKEIEKLRDAFQFTYIESVLYWCDEHDYEIERIGREPDRPFN